MEAPDRQATPSSRQRGKNTEPYSVRVKKFGFHDVRLVCRNQWPAKPCYLLRDRDCQGQYIEFQEISRLSISETKVFIGLFG